MRTNPFHQPAHYWMLEFHVPKDHAAFLESVFADSAEAVSSFEVEDNPILWRVELLFTHPPKESDIKRRLSVLKSEHGITTPPPDLTKIPARDWVSETSQAFPPLRIGRYFAYGSHFRDSVPHGAIPLLINAGAAFGSGEHATTSGCLQAFDWLARKQRFANMLDMGCGSAILAIALAKRFHKPVLAVDIDPVSVKVASENIRLNRAQHYVQALAGNGFSLAEVKRRGPYDLIAANILARPLMRMAPYACNALKNNGIIVLSGLLGWQENMVRNAYHLQGLCLIYRLRKNGWHTLVMRK